MGVEEKSKRVNVELYKTELKLLKLLPFLLALIHFINTMLNLSEIDLPFLSYIGSISLLPLIFLLLSSYVFSFCIYHRLPIYYCVVNNIISVLDFYIQLPLTIKELRSVCILIFGIFIFVILYCYLKSKKNG